MRHGGTAYWPIDTHLLRYTIRSGSVRAATDARARAASGQARGADWPPGVSAQLPQRRPQVIDGTAGMGRMIRAGEPKACPGRQEQRRSMEAQRHGVLPHGATGMSTRRPWPRSVHAPGFGFYVPTQADNARAVEVEVFPVNEEIAHIVYLDAGVVRTLHRLLPAS